MAKGKRAAALFEVIQAAREKEQLRAKGGGFLTPSWWFKGKPVNGAPTSTQIPPTPTRTESRPRNVLPSTPAPIVDEPIGDESIGDESIGDESIGDEPIDTESQSGSSYLASEREAHSSSPAPAFSESSMMDSSTANASMLDSSAADLSSSDFSSTDSLSTDSSAAGFSTRDEAPSGTFTPEPAPPPVHHDFVDNEEPALEDPKPAQRAPQIPPTLPRESKSNHAPLKSTPSRQSSSTGRKPVDVGVDRGRQQIVLRLSFTSAAISTFALIVVVALAVLIGKNFGKGPAAAGAASIADVRKTKPNSSVLSVFQGKSGGDDAPIPVAPALKPVTPQRDPKAPAAPAKQNETGKDPATPQSPAKQPGGSNPAGANTARPNNTGVNNAAVNTTGLNTAGKRIVGEQYVLIQSYPDPEDANDARDALVKAGIDCTVEKGTRWARQWSSVIGTRGFDHTKNNKEFDDYMKSIRDVSNVFAGPSRFRKFEPQVVGWRE